MTTGANHSLELITEFSSSPMSTAFNSANEKENCDHLQCRGVDGPAVSAGDNASKEVESIPPFGATKTPPLARYGFEASHPKLISTTAYESKPQTVRPDLASGVCLKQRKPRFRHQSLSAVS